MKRAMSWALLAAGTALAISAAPAIPAAAAASGSETLSGTIVFAATGPATRTVIGSAVRARGAFKGTGRFVEVAFGDPVSQDDLVFPGGTLHVLATTGRPVSPFVTNLRSCLFTGTAEFTYQVTGGTGKFTGATGTLTGTVSARAQFARNPDGTCSMEQLPRHEVDKFDVSGTLTF
jgi:hypothetical protein